MVKIGNNKNDRDGKLVTASDVKVTIEVVEFRAVVTMMTAMRIAPGDESDDINSIGDKCSCDGGITNDLTVIEVIVRKSVNNMAWTDNNC